MKRKLYLALVSMAIVAAFSSCKKDSDTDTELEFSPLTVEQQKQSIEQNGIDLMDKMNGLQDTKAVKAILSLQDLSGSNTPAYVKALVKLQAGLAKNDLQALPNFNKTISVTKVAQEQQSWGTYTWNPLVDDYDYVKGTANTITVLFPATSGASKNNAEFKLQLTNSGVKIPSEVETDNVLTYMPSAIVATLKVDNAVVLQSNYTATYNSDATPSSVSEKLVVDAYNWTVDYTNNNKALVCTYSMSKSNEVLMKAEVNGSGKLTISDIRDFDNQESQNPGELLSSGKVYFQILNIAFQGEMKDLKSLYSEIDAVSSKLDDKTYNDKTIAIFNKYVTVYGYFLNEKKKFAQLECYNYNDVYDDYVYNETTGSYVYTKNVSHYEVFPRMILSDGSKVSMEDYVATGFDKLIKKLQEYN